MKTYNTYQVPTPPALAVTGAAARSVAAADEAGRAAHQALADVHAAMVAHDQARPEKGIDATWCAQALRLIRQDGIAWNAIRNGTLVPRWRQFGLHQGVTWTDATKTLTHCSGNLEVTWKNEIKTHAAALANAGVPPVSDPMTPEAWDDAAARGC